MNSFFTNAESKFNNKFTYLKETYKSMKKPISIICPTHGEFSQTPQSHLKSPTGCPKCSSDRKKGTLSSFIDKANKLHDFEYDYSKSIYINASTHLTIICKKHGEFKVTPNNHLSKNKYKCPECGKTKKANTQRITTKEFIKQANKVHNNKYDYSKTNYTGAHKKIIVICVEHGEWIPTASNHKNNKSGCPQCSSINKSISKYEDYIEKYLVNNAIKYSREQSFIDLVNPKTDMYLRVDFWIPELNTIIEYDGEHHFIPVSYGDKNPDDLLKYTQYKDSIKNSYCENNSIKLIRIPYKIKTEQAIINILEKSLS
jgi:hypothetical protein